MDLEDSESFFPFEETEAGASPFKRARRYGIPITFHFARNLYLCIDGGIARSSLVRVRLTAIIIRRWRVTVR